MILAFHAESNVESTAKLLPDSLKIPSSQLKVSGTAIGAGLIGLRFITRCIIVIIVGEFGIVYKGVLLDNRIPIKEVAVKALKGISMFYHAIAMIGFAH